MELNKIHQGDCLELGHEIEPGSVDLILTDLPYGTVRGIGDMEGITHGMSGKTKWDIAIDPKDVHNLANRILRKSGKMVLFSQEPYTTQLIINMDANTPFNYRMVWEKDHFANSLLSKKAPVGYYEDILVFSKIYDTNAVHPLRQYFKQLFEYIGKTKKSILEEVGQRADHVFRFNSTQFDLCTESTYNALIDSYGINNMNDFKDYETLKKIDEEVKTKYFPSTFNLWEGKKYKSNILKYKKDYNGYHPTQKPLLLLEDLIKTFSNEGDTVVDLTCGSGSTCVAAQKTGRSFIGIEKEKEYVDIANERIKNHTTQTDIFDVLEGN